MNESSSNSSVTDESRWRQLLGWVLVIFALFPSVALFSYDWHAIDALQSPAAPSTNLIGVLGDGFAYYGYLFFGLAVWLLPLYCVLAALINLFGGDGERKPRAIAGTALWLGVLTLSIACLLQTWQLHAPGLRSLCDSLNIANAGGAIGYLVMTRLFAPLIGDFGASIAMTVLLVLALVNAIGLRAIARFFAGIWKWAMGDGRSAPAESEKSPEDEWNAQWNWKPEPAPTAPPVQPSLPSMPAPEPAPEPATPKESLTSRIKSALAAAKSQAKSESAAESASAAPAPAAPRAAAPRAAAPRADAPAAEPEKPVVDKGPYILPSLSLLKPVPVSEADHGNVGEMSKRLIDTLNLFGIKAQMAYTVEGPVVTKYAVSLMPGTRYSVVTGIQDNLMGALHATSLRIEAPIPGQDCVGIEVPNAKPAGISFREVIESDTWKNSHAELPLLFGKDAAGHDLMADLAKMPHMLVAGATGQGKSVCLNSIICGLLMSLTPQELKFIMVDPKSVEFDNYKSLPHLLVPVISENAKAARALAMAVIEMEKRLKLFTKAHVKNIFEFNHRKNFTQTDMFGNDTAIGSEMPKTIPYIVIIIDEVADLMAAASKEVTPYIARLTAKARAAGIHLILATQRPDAKIITGTIKANIPGRVAFKTSSGIDSRTILDQMGAENLIGRGDMLFRTPQGNLVRAQGAYISDEEIWALTGFIQEHADMQLDEKLTGRLARVRDVDPEKQFEDEENEEAEMSPAEGRAAVRAAENASNYKKALEIIINHHRMSISFLQQRLGIGYNNAARLVQQLEENGVIGPQHGAGPRPITMTDEEIRALFDNTADNAGEEPAMDMPSAGGETTDNPNPGENA